MSIKIDKYVSVNTKKSQIGTWVKTPTARFLVTSSQTFEAECVRVCVRHLDPAEHAGIEDVNASVDLVGHKDLRFLNKAMYPASFRLKHHHAVLRGLLHPRYLHTHTELKTNRFHNENFVLLCFTLTETKLFCLSFLKKMSSVQQYRPNSTN